MPNQILLVQQIPQNANHLQWQLEAASINTLSYAPEISKNAANVFFFFPKSLIFKKSMDYDLKALFKKKMS
jgi:hypothetical protein